MGKVIKILLITIGTLLLLAVLGIAALFIFVDPNSFKGIIIKQVNAATGRQLSIAGDISWSFTSGFGVTVNQISLSNAPGFSSQNFAQLEEVGANIKLLPLLHHTIETGTIRVKGLQLNLAKNKQGKTNWDDMLAKITKEPSNDSQQTSIEKTTDSNTDDSNQYKLIISAVDIQNANVSWNNQKDNQSAQIKLVEFKSENLNLQNEAFPLMMEMQFNADNPNVSGSINLKAKLILDLANQHYQFKKLSLSTNLNSASLPGNQLYFSLNSETDIDLKKEVLNLKQLDASINEMKTSGNLLVKDFDNKPSYTGALTIHSFDMVKWLNSLGQHLTFTNPSALTKVTANVKFSGTPHSIILKPFNMQLDNSNIKGQLAIKNIEDQEASFALNVDKINLDDYMAVAENQQSTKKTATIQTSKSKALSTQSSAAATNVKSPVPLSELRKLNLQGKIAIGQLQVANLNISNFKSQLSANDGIFNLGPTTAKLYSGSYTGQIKIDVTGSMPKISVNQRLANVQIQPLLKDVDGPKFISGTANFATKLTTQGMNADSFTRNLNGTVSCSIENGAIQGLDLTKALNLAVALFNKRQPGKIDDKNMTPFAALSGTFEIDNGVAITKDLSLTSPILSVLGKGTYNLSSSDVNFNLNIKTIGNIIPNIGGLEDLLGGSIPIKITGKANGTLIPRPDEQALFKATTKDKIKKGIDKSVEKLKSLFN